MKTIIALASAALLSNSALAADPRSPSQIIAEAPASHWRRADPENTLYLDTDQGRVVVELAEEFAPQHAANIKALAREHFYDGLSIYRVVEGFVAQGGDRSGEKSIKNAKRTVPAEFSQKKLPLADFTPLRGPDGYAPQTGFSRGFPAARDLQSGEAWLVHCPGAFAMARENDVNSGGTEFYVVLGPAQRYLDRNTTVFGRVLEGMGALQKLQRGEGGAGMLESDYANKILRLRLATDLPEKERENFEIMKTDSPSFAELIAARRHRPEEWFVARPDYVDVCSVGIPTRKVN